MNKLTSLDIQKIEKLNHQLTIIEEKIYNLAMTKNQRALKMLLEKENDIFDYELEVDINIYTNKDDEDSLVSWDEYMKPHFLDDKHCNINDKRNHNVSSAIIKNSELNSQMHCWLMHRLYDDFFIS